MIHLSQKQNAKTMKPIEKKAIKTFFDAWEYWNNRSLETLDGSLIHWSEHMQAFGSAVDEIWRGKEDFKAYSQRAFEENPEGFKVEANWIEAKHLSDQYVMIWGEMKIIVESEEEKLEIEPIRFTGVLKDVGNHMEYVQWHASAPDISADEEIWGGSGEPKKYEEVSVLFTDFVGFTNIVASIPAKKLVSELKDIFRHFDEIMLQEGLEKIRIIGDAYLAVCGLPKTDPEHAFKCVAAAKRILQYLSVRNKHAPLQWEARIGIHSGPLTGGVMPSTKSNQFMYDIFGDTVNVASRMESSGEKNKINVSAITYELIKDRYSGEYRGKIPVKGKGEMDMYFVL